MVENTNNETILMTRPELEEMIDKIVKKAVREVLDEKAEEATELDEYYTVKELAVKWRVSTQCIWRHVKLGHLTPVHIGSRVLFNKDEINKVGNLKYTRKRDNSPVIIK